ncbi:hypothetical protein [Sporosarcina aquimarina]|uniref:Uncharacterized protein n=1 Tax=Sporosarcina aquimarina TaxID=114975 RepID=A0ABU4G3R1_9BACL|nr:hypothetical protein [Sporosarcina aquimarina]MDW0110948.1 hypothetical protein [Sporosarcina aquimarina]
MKRLKLKYILSIFLLSAAVIFAFHSHLSSAKYSDQNKNLSANDIANDIVERINEMELTIQIENELKKKGYQPAGLVSYQIYSPDEQYVVISLEKKDQINETIKKDIQKIVDSVSKENNFNSFVVDLK